MASVALNADDADPSFAIEMENKRLQNEMKLLNEKLDKAEKELVGLRAENENMKEHASRSSKKSEEKRRPKSNSTKSAYRSADTKKKEKKPLKDSSVSSDSSSQSTSSIDTAKLKVSKSYRMQIYLQSLFSVLFFFNLV